MRFLLHLLLFSALLLAPILSCGADGGLCSGDVCNDGNDCTVDTCDPTDGNCEHMLIACDDGDPCTHDACDPADGECRYTPVACDDDNACTVDACDPGDGSCEHTPAVCDDTNVCTRDQCNPADGMCEYPPIPNLPLTECELGNLPGLCLDGECVGACEVPDPCREIECFVGVCDPADGHCDYTPAEVGAPCGQGGGVCCPGQICWAPGLVCPDVP
jgi:hypothetical protein